VLLPRLDKLALACATLRSKSSCVLDTGTKAAAAAQAGLGRLVTDPFNSHDQYAAIDIDVTAISGSDLAAKLPGSWLPLAKNTPLFENAIRQRGYLVRSSRQPVCGRMPF
jgi:hypothetical protein